MEIEKKTVREVARGDKHHLRKSADGNANQKGVRSAVWFACCNLQIFSGSAHHLEQSHAQSLFSVSNSFSVVLIWFIFFSVGRTIQDGAGIYSIICLWSSITCRAIRESWTRSADFWQRKEWAHCEVQRHNGDHLRREKQKCANFWQRNCKLISNLSATILILTSLPSVSLNISFSLSHSFTSCTSCTIYQVLPPLIQRKIRLCVRCPELIDTNLHIASTNQ